VTTVTLPLQGGCREIGVRRAAARQSRDWWSGTYAIALHYPAAGL